MKSDESSQRPQSPGDSIRPVRPPEDDAPLPPVSLWTVSVQEVRGDSGETACMRDLSGLPETDPGAPLTVRRPTERSAEQYTLRRLLGRGGMGEVWEAVQNNLGRVVAVKRIRPRRGNAFEQAMSEIEFRREAVVAARLEHPNIVPVHDLGQTADGSSLLAMKLVQGRSWDRMMAEDRAAMGYADFLAKHLGVLVSMAQAVAFAHSRGVVHRDLKPSQVMVGDFGEVMLMDWGLAVVLGELFTVEENTQLPVHLPTTLEASNPAGTPAFMAPEQTTKTGADIGPWTDVFLLGGTLFFVLTGDVPFPAPTSQEALAKASLDPVRDPRQRRPDLVIPEDLAQLCLRATRRDWRERLQSAREFLDELQEILTGSRRRREATAILELATQSLANARDYRAFSDVLMQASQAMLLWPENPGARPLLDRAQEGYVRLALAKGDLELARVQAERLPTTSEARERLLEEVTDAVAAVRAREGQRRLLRRGVFALLLLVIVGGFWSHRALSARELEARQQRSRAEAEQQRAEQERIRAEDSLEIASLQAEDSQGMVIFLLEELGKTLDLTEARDENLARTIAADVLRRTEAVRTEGWPDNLLEERRKHLQKVAHIMVRLGRHDEGLTLVREARRIALKLHGADSEPAADADYLEGTLLSRQDRVEEAIPYLEASTAQFLALLGPDHLLSQQSMVELGAVYVRAERVEEAVAMVRRALDAPRGPGMLGAHTRANTLNTLGEMYRQLSLAEEAIAVLEEAIAVLEEEGEGESQNAATLLNNLAAAYRMDMNHTGALAIYERALEIQQRVGGATHPQTGVLYANLAAEMAWLNRYPEADALYEKSLEILRPAFAADHRIMQAVLERHAAVKVRIAEVTEPEDEGEKARWRARMSAEEALEKLRILMPDEEPEYREALRRTQAALDALAAEDAMKSRIGSTLLMEKSAWLWRLETPDAALGPVMESYAIREELFGKDTWELAEAGAAIAKLLLETGREEEALPYLEEALPVVSRLFGKEKERTRGLRAQLASSLLHVGRVEDARPLIEQLARIGHPAPELYARAREAGIEVTVRETLLSKE